MTITDFLSENCIIEELKGRDLKSVIDEMAIVLSKEINGIIKPEEISRAILSKEKELKEEALGGVLIPHVRFDRVSIGVKGALGRSKNGIDGVYIVFMLIGDNESADRFIRALSLISNFFRDKKNYNSVLKAESKKEIFEIMREKGME
jgi:mannitol/fructose-specific phosphotransferase system IIA component (Ntr-type)